MIIPDWLKQKRDELADNAVSEERIAMECLEKLDDHGIYCSDYVNDLVSEALAKLKETKE